MVVIVVVVVVVVEELFAERRKFQPNDADPVGVLVPLRLMLSWCACAHLH